MHASLQRKFSFSYIAIILAVLILLNTYPLITSENLTFRSKQSSLQGSVSVMVTALSGLEELSEENVAGAMTLVEETGISRVLVTDASGRVLYDTRETDGAIGRYAFYTELVQALRGEDVFYTEFSDKAFKSRAASPVIYHSQTIGAVYAYEYDTEQAELLLSLQRNLLTISAVVLVFAGGISVLLSRVLTRRFGVLTTPSARCARARTATAPRSAGTTRSASSPPSSTPWLTGCKRRRTRAAASCRTRATSSKRR